MISLIVTIIVLILLALIFFRTSSDLPDEATYARFVQEINNVQSGVYDERIKNAQYGDSEDKINAGFTKVTLIDAPDEFESFDFTGNSVVGYVIGLDKIRYENAEFGHGYTEGKTELEFDKDDAYVYDATGAVYYVKGLEYNDTRVYSIANISAVGLTSTEDGPIISNIIVASGELDDGTKTSAKAKVIISAFPRNGGDLTVMVRSYVATEQPDGTYATQVSRNGTYTIIVTEENGGRTVSKVTVTGIIESTEPPSNLSIVVNNGEPYATEQIADVVVRADGATKMLISKNNPLRPSENNADWQDYEENFEYDLGSIEGKITLYAWFMDEFSNVTETIVKATVTYDKTPPSKDKPTLTATGPYVIVESNQTDRLSSDAYLESTMLYGYRVTDGMEAYEDDYTWSTSAMVGPLENKKSYDFVTKATDEASLSSISLIETLFVDFDYTIKFDTQGGQGEYEDIYTGEGEPVVLPSEEPTRIGYYFVGWSERADALPGDTEDIIGASETYTPTGSLAIRVLYAIWQPRTDTPYKVLHYVEKLTPAGEYELRLTEELTGTTGQDAVANPKTTEDFFGFTENGAHTDRLAMDLLRGDGSTQLRLYYYRSKYKLTVTAENGTATGGAESVPYESEVQLMSSANPGYEFDKWIISGAAEGSEEYANFVSENGNMNPNVTFKMPGKDVTLIAKYKVRTYKITYELDGGVLLTDNPTEYSKETPGFTLNNPTKTGYAFAGWTGTELLAPTVDVTINPALITNMIDREYIANYSPTDDLLTMAASPSTPTSGVVRVTISCLDPELKVEYRIGDAGSWDTYSVPVSVDENTTVYARALKDGVIIDEETLVIANIDKVKPVIEEIKVSEKWTPGTTLVLNIVATDNIRVDAYAITATSSEPAEQYFEKTSGDVAVAENGLNYVWVKDEAKNITGTHIYVWDISENQDEKVYAILNGDTLSIVGNGATKAYSEDEVPYSAFRNDIKNIEIEDGITVLNDNVISNMPNVKSISIPESLTEITEDAMLFTNNFTNIDIASGNQDFVYEDYTLYSSDKTTIYIHSKADEAQIFTIDGAVTDIRKYAFYDNDKLKKVVANGNANISESAFEGCNEIIDIEGKIGGTQIGKNAFAGCEKLEIISLSDTLESIGTKAFYNTTNLASLIIPKSLIELGTDGEKEVFKNIGIDSANIEGKGIVKYYQSTTVLHQYAITYETEAIFEMIDDIGATLLELKIDSPASGTYPIGTEITFVARFDEVLDTEKTTLPELKIKVGSGAEQVVSNGEINGDSILYTYTVKDTDQGDVTFVSFEGAVYDLVSNVTNISATEMTGSIITIDTFVKLEEGTNTYYFTSLQDAVDAAKSRPETASKITMLKDITESVTISSGKNIALYPNGKVLTAADGTAAITNNATLEIIDNGKITASASTTIENATDGVLKVTNTEIENTSISNLAAIVNNANANTTITDSIISGTTLAISNDGALEVLTSRINSADGIGVKNNSNATINIEGTSITVNADSSDTGIGIEVATNSVAYLDNVNINAATARGINNAGTVELRNATIIDAERCIDNAVTGTMKIYDAEISNESVDISLLENKGRLEIYGGKLISQNRYVVLNEGGNMLMAGGTLIARGMYATVSNSDGAELSVTGGTIIGETGHGINNSSILNIQGESIITSYGGYGIYNEENGNLTVSKGTISSSGEAALANRGTANMTGGEIVSNAKYGILNAGNGSLMLDMVAINSEVTNGGDTTGIYNASTNTLFIDNSTINVNSTLSNSNGIIVETGSVVMDMTTIFAEAATGLGKGILNVSGEVTVGEPGINIDADTPRIEGSTHGYDSTGGILNFYDGKFVGNENQSLIGDLRLKPISSYVKRELDGTRETAKLAMDTDKPINVTLTASTTNWTNNKVTLSGEATDLDSGIIEYAFTESDLAPTESEWTKLGNAQANIVITTEYDKTASVYFHVKDLAGNVAVSNKVEVKYDNVAPDITSIVTEPAGWSKGNVTLKVTATDGLSGVCGYQFATAYHELSEIDGNYTHVSPVSTLEKGISTANGKWHIYVIDQAGNVKYTSYEVNVIDTVIPSITVIVSEYGDETSKIKIEATDAESGVETIKINENELTIQDSNTKENTKEAYYDISTSESFEIKAYDKVGNEASKVIQTYIVMYHANGGTGEVPSQVKISEENILVKENEFARDGFIFNYWNTKADGTGTNYNPDDELELNENVTLYAMWNDRTSPVILDVTTSSSWITGTGADVILRINATDNKAVTGYAITTTNTTPTTWSDTPDITIANGDGTYYVWATDADGNISMIEIKLYDISEVDGEKSAVAIIKPDPENANKQTLAIEGTGATKDYTLDTIPWKDEASTITDVEIKDGIEEIGSNLLSNLTNVDQIIISDTVTTIAIDTFVHTNNFNDILVEGNNFEYTNGILYDAAKETLYVSSSKVTIEKVVLPVTIENMGPYAFENSKAVEIVSLPNIDIPEGAFCNATVLKKITTEDVIGGTLIGASAFEGCVNLENLNLSQDIESLGEKAFYNCEKLTDLVMGPNITSMSGNNIFTNIGINAGNAEGKGIVYYYESSIPMVEYATSDDTKDQAIFIPIDNVKPYVESVLINDGADATSDPNVKITINAVDNREVVSMIVTESDSLVPTAESELWIDYNTEYDYTFSGRNGEKTIYVWVKDITGNISETSFADSIILVEHTFEFVGEDEVVQYVDTTGKDYYEYRDLGYSVTGEGCTVEVESEVNHNQVGVYEVIYNVLYNGTSALTYSRKVNVIENNWQSTVITDGDYEYVLHATENYAKIVGYNNSNNATELELPSSFTSNGTEYPVIDLGDRINGLAKNGSETQVAKITLPDSAIAVSAYAFSNFVNLSEIEYGDLLMTIGEYAFANSNGTYDNLVINDNVREVKDNAFYLTQINSLTIENGVKYIGEYAFRASNSGNGTTLEIPASVEEIGIGAFWGYKSNEIIVAEDNANYKDVEGIIITNKVGNTLYQYALSVTDTEYTIPNGIQTVEDGAFGEAKNLENVILGSDVTSLNWCAFEKTTNLKTVENTANLTYIGVAAFRESGLEKFEISESIEAISRLTFKTTKLQTIYIPEAVTEIEVQAFSDIATLKNVVVAGAPLMDEEIFQDSTALEQLVMLDAQNVAQISGDSIELGTSTIVYVPSTEMKEKYEDDSKWGALGVDRIKCIYELIGDAEISLNHGQAYAEQGIKLFDETISTGEGASTKVKGFESIYESNVDVNTVDQYEVKYTIVYNTEEIGTLTRIVNILDTQGAEITGIETSPDWEPGTDLKVDITAEDDYDSSNLEYAVTPSEDPTDAEWSTDSTVTLDEGTNYIHVKDDSGNITTIEITVWDISENGDMSVIAYLKPDGELVITGDGETQSITRGDAPWKDESSVINKITIEEGVTSLGDYILSDLENVNQITIPSTLGSSSDIADTAFAGTNNYETITVAPENTSLKADDQYTLSSDDGTIIYTHSRKDESTSYTIPTETTKIAEDAFTKNNNLIEINMEGNADIGDGAFAGCVNLTTISGDIGKDSIGTGAFSGDISLEDITISKTVTSLGTDVFEGVPGPVYYYISCDAMVEYVKNNPTETDFRLIDDLPPSSDAPTLKASSSTIVVTSNQKDEHSTITKIEYIIRKDGEEYREADWQTESYFTKLDDETTYYVKTRVTDANGNVSESEEAFITTEKVPDEINITATPLGPTSGDVTVTVEWPEADINDLYGTSWPEGTEIIKQVGIKVSGDADITWQDVENQDATTTTIVVSENNTTIYATLYDGQNYTEQTISLTVGNIDRVGPEGSVVINNGDSETLSQSIKLTLTANDDRVETEYGVKYYYASEDSTEPVADPTKAGWLEYTGDGDYEFELTQARGTKTVYVWFIDAAGNISDAYSDAITLLANAVRLEQNNTTIYYDSLLEAVNNAVKTSPAVASRITLLKNITGEGTIIIEESQNIVMDMNGYNITQTGNTNIGGILNAGSLRIENLDTTKASSINVITTSGNAYGIYNIGLLEVDSVSIKAEAPSGSAIGIYNKQTEIIG